MRKKKLMTMVAALGLVGSVTVGGTVAYMTDNEATTNVFTVGQVQVDLTETEVPPEDENENGIPDSFENLVSRDERDKNPVVTNTGTNDAIVFLRFDIPMASVITAEDDGTRIDSTATNQDLFGWQYESGGYNTTGTNWVYIDDSYIDDNGDEAAEEDATFHSYVYGYSLVLNGYDDETYDSTTAIFDQVRLVNIVEGFLENEELTIPVYTYAIQADNIANIDVSEGLNYSNLTSIYQVYLNQNSGIETSDADENGAFKVDGTAQ